MSMSVLKSIQLGARLALSDKVNVYLNERLATCAGNSFYGI